MTKGTIEEILMVTVLCFDLDNTLVSVDETEFSKVYTKLLASYFKDIVDMDLFGKVLIKSTVQMLNNDGKMNNHDRFFDEFTKHVNMDYQEIIERFERFYLQHFPQLKIFYKQIPQAQDIIHLSQEAGFELIIASNPIWAEKIAKQRITWAGLDPAQFMIITHAQNMHYCKPNRKYYTQIVDKLDIPPQEMAMIGNNSISDMTASLVGMSTFLLREPAIDSLRLYEPADDPLMGYTQSGFSKNDKISIDKQGGYQELKAWIQEL